MIIGTDRLKLTLDFVPNSGFDALNHTGALDTKVLWTLWIWRFVIEILYWERKETE